MGDLERNRRDVIRNPEEMQDVQIALIGGQGHFGSQLLRRLEEIQGPNVRIRPTADKVQNVELVSHSRLVVLTVRPDQVDSTLNEIQPALAEQAQILSFAAQVPLSRLKTIAKRPATRMMVDPWWHVSAFTTTEDFSQNGFEFIFQRLTRVPPIHLVDDREIDRFTILLAPLFVTLLLKRAGRLLNADAYTNYIASQMNIPSHVVDEFTIPDTPEEALVKIATKGGISEATLRVLEAEPNISPEKLIRRVEEKFAS